MDSQEMLDAYLDGELTPEMEAELRAWLAQDPEHMRIFARAIHDNRLIRDTLLAQTGLKGSKPAPEPIAMPLEAEQEPSGNETISRRESERSPEVPLNGDAPRGRSTGLDRRSVSSRRLRSQRPSREARRPLWPVLLAACVLAGVSLYIAFRGSGLTRVSPPEIGKEIGKVVFVVEIKKEALPILVRTEGGQTTRKTLTKETKLLTGDRIETSGSLDSHAANSDPAGQEAATQPRPVHVALVLAHGATVDLADATCFELGDEETSRLKEGLLYATVAGKEDASAGAFSSSGRTPRNAPFQIKTAFANVEAARACFDLRADSKEAVLQVESGAAQLKNAQGEVALGQRQKSTAKKDTAPTAAASIQASTLWRARRGALALEEGLAGHWKLDEGAGAVAKDASGHNYHGALVNTPVWTRGAGGTALRFTKQTPAGFVNIPNSGRLEKVQEGDFSLCAWFKPCSVPTGVFRPDGNSDENVAFAVVLKSGFHEGLFYTRFQGFYMAHWLAGDRDAGAGNATVLPPGVFYHVVGVVERTKGQTRIYVNGRLDGTRDWKPNDTPRAFGAETWKIGIGAKPEGMVADAEIKDVRIYQRVLSPEEIAALAEPQAP